MTQSEMVPIRTSRADNPAVLSRSLYIPDRSYTKTFHSPGVEPWVCEILKRAKSGSLLDMSCGLGFWGFLTKTYVGVPGRIVGADISTKKLQTLKRLDIYDGLVRCDARSPPFQEKTFDCILMVEILHRLAQINKVLSNTESLLKKGGLLIVAGPSNKRLLDCLLERNYKIYAYHLRGLVLVDLQKMEPLMMYTSKMDRFVSHLITFLHKLFGKRIINYILAIKTP